MIHLNCRSPFLKVLPRTRNFYALSDGSKVVCAQERQQVVVGEPGVRLPQLQQTVHVQVWATNVVFLC